MSLLWLNLGCGGDRRKDPWLGVDRVEGPAVDQVVDLNEGPWPWADNAVDRILAQDIFEHVDDAVLFMTECWRVLMPGGALFLKTPHWRHRDAYTDPTHKRFPTEHTFDYWIPGTVLHDLHGAAYGGVGFMPGPLLVREGAIHLTLFKVEPLEYPMVRDSVKTRGVPRDPGNPSFLPVTW